MPSPPNTDLASPDTVRLSAAIIVRDEAAHLRRCLASIVPLVHEIVVVDTGSSDDSPRVAAAFGARVSSFPWRGDFAAARNAALERATGAWILYIDADERAQPTDTRALLATLADPRLVAASVRFRPRAGVTRYDECRLFRNDPRIRFRNVIHETMLPSVHAVARADGLAIGRTALALDHHGYDGDQGRKHRRNIPLLRQRLARDPDHVYSWNHLGQALDGSGDRAAALACWRRAIAIVRARGVESALDALPYGSLLLAEGVEDAPALLDEARARFPGDLLFRWLAGRRMAQAGAFDDAVRLLDPLAGIDAETYCAESGVSYDASIFGVPTWDTLAMCHFQRGRYAEAAYWWGRAADAEPQRLELRTKRRLAEARNGARRPGPRPEPDR
ncbi:glycosyltransferase [bacterium]|nr:glycosyltransferase [bacterium]